MKSCRGGRVFSSFAHVISAVAATAAAHPRSALASKARSWGPSRRSTSAQGLTLVNFSARRFDLLYDTLWEEAGQPRTEEKDETETETVGAGAAGWGSVQGVS